MREWTIPISVRTISTSPEHETGAHIREEVGLSLF